MKEIKTGSKILPAIVPQTLSADANGADIDTSGGAGPVLIEGQISDPANPLAAATTGWQFELEEADDNGSGSPGSYGDVAEADIVGAISGTTVGAFKLIDTEAEAGDATKLVFKASYIGRKRWIRVVANAIGSPGDTIVSATALLFPLRNSADAN